MMEKNGLPLLLRGNYFFLSEVSENPCLWRREKASYQSIKVYKVSNNLNFECKEKKKKKLFTLQPKKEMSWEMIAWPSDESWKICIWFMICVDWFYQQNPSSPCFTVKNIWRYLNFVVLEELHAIDCTTCLSYIWILLWERFRCFLFILNSASILHYKIKLKLIRRHSVKPIISSTGKNQSVNWWVVDIVFLIFKIFSP